MHAEPSSDPDAVPSKIPEITLVFWIIKIAATTLGETGGDAVTMTLKLGYLIGTVIFAVVFIGALMAQLRAKRFHPLLYWFVIIATTTVGTTLADFAGRSLGIGYVGGSRPGAGPVRGHRGARALHPGLHLRPAAAGGTAPRRVCVSLPGERGPGAIKAAQPDQVSSLTSS